MPTYDPNSVTLTIGGVRMEGVGSVTYRDAPPGSVVGVDGRVKGRVALMPPGSTPTMLDAARRIMDADPNGFEPASYTTPSSFGRGAMRALVASTAADLGLDATVEVSEPDPPDGRVLVTVGDSRGHLRSRELAAIRAALAPFLPAGIAAVVRDAAQLRAMRERALAPLAEEREAITAAEIRARMGLREGWRR